MTSLTAPGAMAPEITAAARGTRFAGQSRAFWRIVGRGAVLLMVTLGLYRFWLTTDIRRFLWSHTELAGESFEYAGTARELLLGFLIAIAILTPLYAALFVLSLALRPLGAISNFVALLLLAVMGQYAIYRARRYRLSRTIYRGVRFHQTGSAWRYAVCALFWWTLTVVSLGLCYPFAKSRLERFKMRNTFFGTLPGRFEGSGFALLLRGFVLWLLTLGPLIAGIAATVAGADWSALAALTSGDDVLNRLESSGIERAALYGILTLLWLVIAVGVLYPCFQAMVLRWWASGLRFGALTVSSKLRTAQVFGVYLRFLWYALLFTLAALAAAALIGLLIARLPGDADSMAKEIVATAGLVLAYVIFALGYSTIYQATIRLGLWRCVVDTLEIGGLTALDGVTAAGAAASPIGEGLADALNVGGL